MSESPVTANDNVLKVVPELLTKSFESEIKSGINVLDIV
jgi:hypothetical protein